MNYLGNCFKTKDSQYWRSSSEGPEVTNIFSKFRDFRQTRWGQKYNHHSPAEDPSGNKKYKQVYELSRKQCKYFHRNGHIRLNVKLKPGVCISEFDIVITKDNVNDNHMIIKARESLPRRVDKKESRN